MNAEKTISTVTDPTFIERFASFHPAVQVMAVIVAGVVIVVLAYFAYRIVVELWG